jgi:hypothetical protein
MDMILHALPDDWNLNANRDSVERGAYLVDIAFPYYLTDPAGDRLTDPAGNYLIGYELQSFAPQVLHALPDDFNLNG